MEFDVTHINKVTLIQALFAHASPRGLGTSEYIFLKNKGINVLTVDEAFCHSVLHKFNKADHGVFMIVDYHNGVPVKLTLQKKRNGRVLTNSDSYDSRNGKYKFLEAMINTFPLDEIYITDKKYHEWLFDEAESSKKISEDEQIDFGIIIKRMVKNSYELGTYWSIDKSKMYYTPEIIKLLNL